MAKPSWGNKRTCNCGIRFYDLNKKQIECPGCGQTVDVELLSISTLENNLRKKSQTLGSWKYLPVILFTGNN